MEHLTRAGGRRAAQPNKSEQRRVEYRLITRIAWDFCWAPLSNYGILLNWLCLKENQKVFARIKIEFVARKTR